MKTAVSTSQNLEKTFKEDAHQKGCTETISYLNSGVTGVVKPYHPMGSSNYEK